LTGPRHSWSGHAVNYYFIGLLALCTIYAFALGGAPERIGAGIYALSVVTTHVLLTTHAARWRGIEFGVFIVDLVTFALFCVLAVRANRFWPIWVSALLGIGVLGHLARWAGPDVLWYAYAVVLTIWSYPILAILALGTFNHRQRLARSGTDRSWSSSFAPSARKLPFGPTT
jgi:hypothetical protein